MFNLGGIAISDYLITNRARFRARGKCRNLTLKNAGRRRTKETVRRGVASRRSWVHSHTDSPRTQMTDVVIRFSQQQQHLHPPSPRRPSAIHSGIHTPTFATAVTSPRRSRRPLHLKVAATAAPPINCPLSLLPSSKLRESPSSLSSSIHTALWRKSRGMLKWNDDGAREDSRARQPAQGERSHRPSFPRRRRCFQLPRMFGKFPPKFSQKQ